jgi:hypothetical protein
VNLKRLDWDKAYGEEERRLWRFCLGSGAASRSILGLETIRSKENEEISASCHAVGVIMMWLATNFILQRLRSPATSSDGLHLALVLHQGISILKL